ncbi:MAG: Holliday junction branch migration protein RuvA [Chlamydiales bacterium]
MLDFIRGSLVAIHTSNIIIENRGLGYKIFFSKNQMSLLPKIGADLLLYLAMIIREDAHTLYGFLTLEERELFYILSRVSGIGPKTAFTILTHTTPFEFVTAIQTKNTFELEKIPGIGKKTIDRFCIELPDRLSDFAFAQENSSINLSADVISALVALGYEKTKAKEAVRRIQVTTTTTSSLSELIKMALQEIRTC